jgi:hypothetical protein
MAIIGTQYHNTAKGITNVNSGTTMTWWKTNFNMPVPYLWTGPWDAMGQYVGPFTYNGSDISYNCSGLSPGFELVVAACIWDWENTGGSNVTLNERLYAKWTDTDGTTPLFWGAYNSPETGTVYPYDWYETAQFMNIGLAPWEIDTSGSFAVNSYTTGTYAMSSKTSWVGFYNVPSVTQMSITLKGYIWVEGNNLCYINDGRWKHTMTGTSIRSTPGTSNKGKIWMDSSNYLHWVGDNGNDYRAQWKIQQVASYFSNGPTGTTYAGTDNAGTLWVDAEFGETHLAYIGTDGYKYLTGAGDYPY